VRQTTEWALANSRFHTFRSGLPDLIDEDCVSEYHAIIKSFEKAGQSDLNDFRIDANKLGFRVVKACTGEHQSAHESIATKNTAIGNISAASSISSKNF